METSELIPTTHSITDATSIGLRLRHARERRGWSQQEVARMLCLNLNIIHALEHDNFKDIGASVFVRGYLKNYARLLDLPLPEYPLASERNSASVLSPTTIESSPSASIFLSYTIKIGVYLLGRFMNYGIFIILALLTFIWWYDRYHANEALTFPVLLKMSIHQTPYPAINLFPPPPFAESLNLLQKDNFFVHNPAIACWQQISPNLMALRGEEIDGT